MVLLQNPGPALKEKREGGDPTLIRARSAPWMQVPVRTETPLSQFVVTIDPPPTAVVPTPVGAVVSAPAPAVNYGEFRGERHRRN